MGVGESTAIQVNFNRPDHCYQPGEQVMGNIVFQNHRDQLKVDDSFVELNGELEYTTTETRSSTDSEGRSTTESYTEYHHISFLTLRAPLTQSKDGTNRATLNAGMHTWPFAFNLPDNVPPSSAPNPTAYPHIKYFIHVLFDRPWYKANIRKNFPLTVFARPTLLPLDAVNQQILGFGDQNRKKLRLDAYISTSNIVPGQPLSLQLNLYNPERTVIKRITATFAQRRHTQAQTHREPIFRTDLPGFNEFSEPYLQSNFALMVPDDYLTPTHAFSTLFRNFSYQFTLDYQLTLEVRPHGAFTKFEIHMPIIVRAKPMNTHAAGNEFGPPPSYEFALKN